MDFELTPEQVALVDSVRRFGEREYDLEKRKAVIRSLEGLNPAHWAIFAELGWLGAGLSEADGGFGGSAVENALIAEELGRVLVTEPFIAHVIATQLLARIGGDTAAALIGAAVMGEKRIAVAVSEAGARGDMGKVATRALPAGNGWAISGVKTLVEGAPSADLLIVPAVTADDLLGLYLIDPQARGVTSRVYRLIDNRRVADVTLEDLVVGPDALLAIGDDAIAALDAAVDHGIVTMCGEALGVMDAALWATRDYLRTRKQFGVPIGSFQALQHRMADMLVEVEMTRSALFQALGAIISCDAELRRAAVSAAKVQFCKGGLFVGSQAIQLHGGIGVTEELAISHYYRRLYVTARQFGDMEFHTARFAAASDRTRTGFRPVQAGGRN